MLITKEKRYLYLLLLGIPIGLIGIFEFNSLFNNIINNMLNFGEIGYRIRYQDYLLNYPLTTSLSLLFMTLIGSFATINYKHKTSSKIFYLTIFVIGSLLIYTRYINTYLFICSRYISFFIPFVFIIISFSFFIITKIINKKIFSFLFIILLIIASITSFTNFSKSYYNFSRHPNLQDSYSTVLENYKPSELIVSYSLRTYYMRGINTTQIYGIPWRKQASFDNFYNNLSSYDSGWVVWEVDKAKMHLRPEIYNYS